MQLAQQARLGQERGLRKWPDLVRVARVGWISWNCLFLSGVGKHMQEWIELARMGKSLQSASVWGCVSFGPNSMLYI